MNARLAQDAEGSPDIEVVLFEVTHPDMSDTIRLSTDNTERVSVDPLMFGTRSTWRGADPATEPFLFILADAKLPDESEDAPAEAQIVLMALDAKYAELLRSFLTPATVNMAVVLASSPDEIEAEFLGLQLTVSDIADDEITLTLSREEIELEHYPPGRMTRSVFRGCIYELVEQIHRDPASGSWAQPCGRGLLGPLVCGFLGRASHHIAGLSRIQFSGRTGGGFGPCGWSEGLSALGACRRASNGF